MIQVLLRFEGPQGCGKSRLAGIIENFLQSKGFSTFMLEETHTMSVLGKNNKGKEDE